MDKMLWIAMSGANENIKPSRYAPTIWLTPTPLDLKQISEQARSMQAFGEGLPTRVFSMTESPGQNFAEGPIRTYRT